MVLQFGSHRLGEPGEETHLALADAGSRFAGEAAQDIQLRIGDLNRDTKPRPDAKLARHGKITHAGIAPSVADIVSDATVEHPLAERVLEGKRRAMQGPSSRPVSIHPLRDLTPVADLGQQGDVGVNELARHAEQPIQSPVAVGGADRRRVSPNDWNAAFRTHPIRSVPGSVAENLAGRAPHVGHRAYPCIIRCTMPPYHHPHGAKRIPRSAQFWSPTVVIRRSRTHRACAASRRSSHPGPWAPDRAVARSR